MTIAREAVIGKWIHSHEEDTDTETIYRPASFAFPASRGRRGLELRDDGMLMETTIGATDVPGEAAGRWELRPDGTLMLRSNSGVLRLRVIRVEPDRLVFSKS